MTEKKKAILGALLAIFLFWIVVACFSLLVCYIASLTVSFAHAEDIPIHLVGQSVYEVYVPTHFEANGVVVDADCRLDTGAPGVWLGDALMAQLRLISPMPAYEFPPLTVPYMRMGTRQLWGQWGRNWHKLVGCTVSQDLWWAPFMMTDLTRMVIGTANSPEEYWYFQWAACGQTLTQQKTYCAWVIQSWAPAACRAHAWGF